MLIFVHNRVMENTKKLELKCVSQKSCGYVRKGANIVWIGSQLDIGMPEWKTDKMLVT